MSKRQNRRNRQNRRAKRLDPNSPSYVCIGVIVKDPNGRNPLKKSSIGDLFAALAKTVPQKPQFTFAALMEMKKPQLVAIAKDQNVKIWLSWNKTKIANAIIGEV
jgi:hypothetical protein